MITIATAVATFVIGLSLWVGSFYPNKWATSKIEESTRDKDLATALELGLKEPEFLYNDKQTFIENTSKCVVYLNYTRDRLSRIPSSIIIAMAGIESAWGTSRFATEGNALFGVRTWSLDTVPHMKALGNMDAIWGVKKYTTKCQSIKDMIRILNTHPAYEGFRISRTEQLESGRWNYRKLMLGMTAWSTNPDYAEIILQTIVDNKLP